MSGAFTPDQEARLRAIVREEIEDDRALRDSRDHDEFLVNSEIQRSYRPEIEAKRKGGGNA